jgi:hypothetical protein
MATFVEPKADFLNKIFVDQNIRKLVNDEMVWEKQLSLQKVTGLDIRYYKEQYVDVMTPNDAAMTASVDVRLRSPNFRAPGGDFPHTAFAEPQEQHLGLYQLGLEVDITDEAAKYAEMENQLLKAQSKLANTFISYVNNTLGNAITENWTGSSINTMSASAVWTEPTASACRPVKDMLDAMEKIEDVSGHSYKASAAFVSKQGYFDLRLYLAEKNYQYKDAAVIGPETKVTMVEGIPVYGTNMSKRAYALVADFKNCGTLYESEPFKTHQYWTDKDHMTHIQAMRTFNFGLSDPKAVTLISATA